MYNTIDLDGTTKEALHTIIQKISKCREGCTWTINDTSKGYHIKMYCQSKDCDMCRMVFDDQRRYFLDMTTRVKGQHNVMFDSKTLGFPPHNSVKECHSRCTRECQ